MSKKFTFEDWLEGRISNNDVSIYTLQHAINIDTGSNEPEMPDVETTKIRKAQKWAFDNAVNITFQDWLNGFKKDYKESPYPEQLMDDKISTLESKFQQFQENIRSTVLKGKPNFKGIDGRSYLLVKKAKETFDETGQPKRIGISEWNNKVQKWQRNEVYEATLIWKQLSELKTLLNQFNKFQPKPNKLTKEMEQKASENEKEKNEIFNTALEIIKESGQDLNFFQTEAKEANAKLYRHPKLNKFDNGNKRRWLRNAMKDGTLKKMLATDGHGTATE